MPIFFIAVLAIMLPIILGAVLAFAINRFDTVVVDTKTAIEQGDRQYNSALTLGHRVKIESTPKEQIAEARQLAATKAAMTPRGANMRIGRKGAENLMTAHDGIEEDPLTAVKIARFHGWDGARAGAPAVGAPQQPAPVAAGPATDGKIELKPGRDYEVVEISKGMSGAEKRKARIANAKAKAQAIKAAKAAGQTVGAAAPAATPAQQPTAQAQPQAVPAAAAGIAEPTYIEITDDMAADEVRKARIANAKTKSAYNKALKAAGVDPSAAAAPAAPAPAATPAPAAAAPAVTGVPEPDYIEITDDMAADEVRKARIANAKTKSAYNKALKAAGVDPSTAAAPAAPASAAAPAPTAEAAAPAATGVPEPDYIEITDDMAADEVRKARIANAKTKSAYNKALKAAGIDPASVQ